VDNTLFEKCYEWSGKRPIMLTNSFLVVPREAALPAARQCEKPKERGLLSQLRSSIRIASASSSASSGSRLSISGDGPLVQQVQRRKRKHRILPSPTDRGKTPSEMNEDDYAIYRCLLLGKRPPFAWG